MNANGYSALRTQNYKCHGTSSNIVYRTRNSIAPSQSFLTQMEFCLFDISSVAIYLYCEITRIQPACSPQARFAVQVYPTCLCDVLILVIDTHILQYFVIPTGCSSHEDGD